MMRIVDQILGLSNGNRRHVMKFPTIPRAGVIGAVLVVALAASLTAKFAQAQNYKGFTCACDSSFLKGIDPGWDPPIAEPPNIREALMRLVVYVVRDSSGEGGFSASQMDTILDYVSRDLKSAGIRLDVTSRDTLDTSLMTVANPWPPAVSGYLSAAVVWRPDMEMSAGGAAGSPANRCYVKLTAPSAGSVLSHELGHCLGLLHTFDRSYGNTGQLPSNCNVGGDMVCDTPYDIYGPGLRDNVDPDTCEQLPEKMPPVIDVTNIMAYTWPHCMDHFTAGQIDRMLYFVETDALLGTTRKTPIVAYENKSEDTDLQYDGTPYSSVILDYNADDLKDLFISMRDDNGSLQKQTQLASSHVPVFTDRTTNDFAYGNAPQPGLRGVVAADYDNDGRIDLFAAADSLPRLYHNNNGVFADSASALGLAALADSSYAGAWGDFDRDGQVDLYVCRGTGGGDDPTAANLYAVRGRLLRNDLRSSGSFTDSSDKLGAATNAVGASVAASWADVDDDSDLDLFVGDLRDAGGSASSRLYVNNGAGSLTESFASRFSGLTIENVNSVIWGDVNIDGKLDLVLGGESAPPTVYLNNGAGEFDTVDPLSASLDAPTNDVRAVDTDLDGLVDLVAIPREASDHRWLFWNQIIEDEQTLLDQSYWAGFADSTGRIDGLAMADFNGDGDTDVYFGRPVDTEDVFYRAKGAAGDSLNADWVGVQLVAGGGNNGSAIGARVRFYIGSSGSPSYQQTQIVDGGSGKGGQADGVLICGLGDRSDPVSAEVKWPGGFVQTATLTRGAVTTITDDTTPGTLATVSGVYHALPEGQAEFIFTWDTPYSCKPSLDKVTITLAPRQPAECSMGTIVLTPSYDNVTHAVAAKTNQAGGGYSHSLTWPLECRAPCAYSFTVESATDATHKNTATGQISMPVCISQ